MSHPQIPGTGTLELVPVWDELDLVAAPVRAALLAYRETRPDLAEQIFVAPVPPEAADTEALTSAFDLDPALSVNCILVGGKRAGEQRIAACNIRATTNADVNSVVRRLLDVRKASFLARDLAVEQSGMEYGAITPVGIPTTWRLLVDQRASEGWACIGSGVRHSKLVLPGQVLATLPGSEVIEGLAN
ncbi:YbaK/EbsC family protein [Scrofimicrobium sp. R131]|uniref:YbaK/EbsC family protein n=1 Tax=Scrofimicrobium appendicitidis TaxID=3079930 RepID=A0AAU7V7T2_9ACTO